MEKIFIASDIHGSEKYCGEMLAAFDASGAETLVLLGDLLYHGPRNDLPQGYAPKEVISMLSAYRDKIIAVRGNCEAEVDAMVLPFPVMADYAVILAGTSKVYITHGHLFSPKSPLNIAPGCIMISGHTHIPADISCGGIRFLNPGSVSIPKNDSPHSYMIAEYDDHGISFRWFSLDGKEFLPNDSHSI